MRVEGQIGEMAGRGEGGSLKAQKLQKQVDTQRKLIQQTNEEISRIQER